MIEASPLATLLGRGRATITLLLWTAFIMSLLGHYWLTSWLPTLLESNGIPLASAVAVGGLVMGGGAVGSLLLGPLIDRYGITALICLFLFSVPLVAAIGFVREPTILVALLVLCAGVCLVGGQVGLNAFSSILYPARVRSSGTGWALGIGRLGSIAGPIIGGWFIAAGVSIKTLFIFAAVPALGCATMLILLRAHLRTANVDDEKRAF